MTPSLVFYVFSDRANRLLDSDVVDPRSVPTMEAASLVVYNRLPRDSRVARVMDFHGTRLVDLYIVDEDGYVVPTRDPTPHEGDSVVTFSIRLVEPPALRVAAEAA